MTAIQLLERCKWAEEDRRLLKNKIARRRDSATRVTSTLDGIGSRDTSEPDKQAAFVAEIDELERELALREREYAVEVAAACKLLDGLPEIEASVMDGYYIKGNALNVLARELSYSYGYVRFLKSSAIVRLNAIPEATLNSMLPSWYIVHSRN